MKMTQLFLVLGIWFNSHPAMAGRGGIGDGGGQSVVCRDENSQVVSAEMLDIFEAKNFYLRELKYDANLSGLDLARQMAVVVGQNMNLGSSTSKTTTISGDVSTLSYQLSMGLIFNRSSNAQSAIEWVESMYSDSKRIPTGVMIPAVGDSTPLVLPNKKGCQIEQVAVYKDASRSVYFVQDIWDKFDSLNQAALLLHESIYFQLRQNGDVTSDRTRKIIGLLFSGYNFKHLLTDTPHIVLNCYTADDDGKFRFLVYGISENAVTANFLVWNGQSAVSQILTRLPAEPFKKYFNQISGPMIANGISELGTVADQVIDVNAYQISYDDKGSLSFQSSGYTFLPENDLKVKCDKYLTKWEVRADGVVSIGPVL